MNDSDIAVSQSDSGKVAAFMSRVYSWMLFGIFLSAITAYFTQLHIPDLIEYIRENPSKVDLIKNVYMGLVFFEIIMVVCL